MGKYDKFKDQIPTYKEGQEELKKKYVGEDQQKLLEEFSRLKLLKETADNTSSELEKELTALSDVLVDSMELLETAQIQHKRLGSFFPRTTVYVHQKDKAKLHEWLRANGYGDVVKEGVHAKTLNSLFTDILDEGSLPEDAGVGVFLKTKIINRA